MATKTSLLGLTKPAYTEAADIAVLNGNFDLIDKAVGNGAYVRNELDNSYFVDPINARGATSYNASGYTVDRWKINMGSNATVTVGNGKITLSKSGTSGSFSQVLPVNLTGKTMTYAVKTANGITCRSAVISSSSSYAQIDGVKAYLSVAVTGGQTVFQIYFNDSSNIDIELYWAALYEGAYTAETLPAYVYKGYAAELMECRRYYQTAYRVYGASIGNVSREAIMLSPPMRVTPTVSTVTEWAGNESAGYTVSSAYPDFIDISYTGWGNVKLALSADL